jgi:hypothetical protein
MNGQIGGHFWAFICRMIWAGGIRFEIFAVMVWNMLLTRTGIYHEAFIFEMHGSDERKTHDSVDTLSGLA